jgi:acetoacetyl-[acyl-carrier protein] synthase
MAILPVIVGYGGFNAAGRSSFDQSYRRMIFESLSPPEQDKTLAGLAAMMNLVRWEDGYYVDQSGVLGGQNAVAERYGKQVLENTLIRQIEPDHYDPDAALCQHNVVIGAEEVQFTLAKKHLPTPVPDGWQLSDLDADTFKVVVSGERECRISGTRAMPVKAAGVVYNWLYAVQAMRSIRSVFRGKPFVLRCARMKLAPMLPALWAN